jgi:hypothetical protein
MWILNYINEIDKQQGYDLIDIKFVSKNFMVCKAISNLESSYNAYFIFNTNYKVYIKNKKPGKFYIKVKVDTKNNNVKKDDMTFYKYVNKSPGNLFCLDGQLGYHKHNKQESDTYYSIIKQYFF